MAVCDRDFWSVYELFTACPWLVGAFCCSRNGMRVGFFAATPGGRDMTACASLGIICSPSGRPDSRNVRRQCTSRK